MIKKELVDHAIQLVGGHSRGDRSSTGMHRQGGDPSGNPHLFDGFSGLHV